jgi:23S rRNA (cytidine1920-2'-O)/16S rRNA (cytidine1409-2'-O)-methyltransferase
VQEVGDPVDLIVVDTSFISVEKFLVRLCQMMKKNGDIVILLKPQFEVGKGQIEKGGVVRDPKKHMRVIEKIQQWGEEIGLRAKGVVESPLRGAKGNKEFFIHFVKSK